MSTDANDSRLFGALEGAVSALKGEIERINRRMEANHSETAEELRLLRSALDRQGGAVTVLRWLGAGLIGLSGWATWALGAFAHRGR